MTEKIKQWTPFKYRYCGYDEKIKEITFTCPKCGSHNCIKTGNLDKNVFWSGHYKCKDCGETKEKGKPINYYSECFIKKEIKEPIQLTLNL